MTEKARIAAEKLFNKLNREDKEAVATVGVGVSEQGNEILIPYLRTNPMLLPEVFDGFLVLPGTVNQLKQVEEVNG